MREATGGSDVARLGALLADDEVPWPAFFLRSGGETIVAVSAIRDLAASRGIDWSEQRLDELVHQLGGSRQPVIDPWSWPSRMLRRLLGKRHRTTDAYTFPSDVIERLRRTDAAGGGGGQ